MNRTKFDLRHRKPNRQDLRVPDKTLFNTEQIRKTCSLPGGINAITNVVSGYTQPENQKFLNSQESGLTRSLRELSTI